MRLDEEERSLIIPSSTPTVGVGEGKINTDSPKSVSDLALARRSWTRCMQFTNLKQVACTVIYRGPIIIDLPKQHGFISVPTLKRNP